MAVDIPQESPKKISEFSHHPRPVAINFKFRPKIQRKSAILGPFFTKYFVVAITFKPMQIFPIRFHRLSTFCQFFAETLIMTIFMAILCQAIMANFSKIAIMAILVWVDVAINMVNMGVSAKNRQNVDSLRKRIGKNRIG